MKSFKRFMALLLCFSMMLSHVAFAASLNINLTLNTDGSVTAKWSGVSGTSYYKLLVVDSKKAYVSEEITTTTRTVNLPENGIYYFYVTAVNSSGKTLASNVAQIIVPSNPSSAPGVPTGIKTSSITTSSVTISWTAVSGATSYEISFDGTIYSVTGTSKTLTGLKPDTSYKFQIRSKNHVGPSEYSTMATVKTLGTTTTPKPTPTPKPSLPTVPTNIKATSTTNSITVSWDAVAGATSYDVLVNGIVRVTTETSLTITGLNSSTSYQYQVRARNPEGVSNYSMARAINTKQGEIIPPTQPPKPTVPTNVAATSTENSITVSWIAVSGATSYDVLVNGKTYSVIGTTRTITGLLPDTIYNYQVRARNTSGSSDYSTLRSIRTKQSTTPTPTPTPNPRPAVPTDLTATPTNSTVTLTWLIVSGATGYDISFNGNNYSTTGTSITLTGLQPDTEYIYQIRSKNASGTSAYSSPRTIRTLPPAPNVPKITNVTATADSIHVAWSPVNNAKRYTVKVGSRLTITNDTYAIFYKLDGYTCYTIQVSAEGDGGSSPFSDEIRKRTNLGTPSDVSATASSNSATVRWSPVNGATSYDVNFNGKNYNTSSTSKTFNGLNSGTNYSYSVKARVDSDGKESEYSHPKIIKTANKNKSTAVNKPKNKKYQDGKKRFPTLDPVDALSGAYVWDYTVLEIDAKDTMDFTVTYSSQSQNEGSVGRKWSHTFDYRLESFENILHFIMPYEDIISFSYNEDKEKYEMVGYEGEELYTLYLKNGGNIYEIICVDGTSYIFDKNLVIKEIWENGILTYSFASNTGGQITRVTGRYGSVINIGYNGSYIANISDPMGNKVILSYTGNNLTKITNPDGDSITIRYDSYNNITELADFSGAVYLKNTYNHEDQIIRQTLAGQGEASAVYDEEKRVNTFTDELGNEVKYYYDEHYNVTKVEDALGIVQNKYNEAGQIIEEIDALGNMTKMTYDQAGRLTRLTYPDGTSEHITYNDASLPVKFVNGDGTEIHFDYDSRDNIISMTDERGKTEYFEYDSQDNLISHKDKNGNTATYTYDSDGILKSYTDQMGSTYQYEFDKIGRLLSTISPLGIKTTHEYTPDGKLTSIEEPDGTMSFTYDKNGNCISITDKRGNTQYFEYNLMGELAAETDFLNNKTTYTYDKRGLLAEEKDPLDYKEIYEYDAVGNLIKETDKNGNTTTYVYNAASQVIEVRNAENNTLKFSYDKMGQIQTAYDPSDNEIKFAYDKMGRITSITDPLGNSVQYTYDKSGNMLSETDENGAVTSYEYDDDDNLIKIISATGTTTFKYDKVGRLVEIFDDGDYLEKYEFDGDGNIISYAASDEDITKFKYNSAGYLSEEIDSEGNITKFEYDSNGNCIKIIDANGNVFVYEYDANDNIIKIVDPLGYSSGVSYDARGEIAEITDANGNQTSFTYDGNGNLIKVINSLGGIVQYTYNASNRIIKEEDENGNTNTYTYDKNGNLATFTDGNNNVWTYEYDANNRLVSITDNDRGKISFSYDKKGNVIRLVDQDGAETNYAYDADDRITKLTDAYGNSYTQSYDSQGRVTAITDANGNTTEYTYTPTGNIKSVKDPEGAVTTYQYNAMGWLMSKTNPLGDTIEYAYDAVGQLLAMTDPEGNVTSFTYNERGEILTSKDAKGNVITYAYDGNGNITQTTDANGNTAYYEYDALNNQIKQYKASSEEEDDSAVLYQYDKKGQRVKEIFPLGGERVYSYDGNGNVIKIVDEDLYVTTYGYNLFDQLSNITYGDGKTVTYRYNKAGELVGFDDWNGTTSMERDLLGRLTKVTDHNNQVTSYTYDSVGNKLSILYPDGTTVKYGYDKNDRIIQVTDGDGQTTAYEYDSDGNTTNVILPNGNTTSYAYNALGLATSISYHNDEGQRMLNTLAYDAVGNIISSVQTGDTAVLTSTKSYVYDNINQLVSYNEDGLVTNYIYDIYGNLTKKTSATEPDTSYSYNALNQLTAKSVDDKQYRYTYDGRGNLKTEEINGVLSKSYFFDATDKMVEGNNLETGEQSKYTYNGLDMRVRLEQKLQNQNAPFRNNSNSGVSLVDVPSPPSPIDDISPFAKAWEDAAGLTQQPYPLVNVDLSFVIDYTSETNNDLMIIDKDNYVTTIVYGRNSERISQSVKPINSDGANNLNTAIATEKNGKVYFQWDHLGSVIFASDQTGQLARYMSYDPWGNLTTPNVLNLNFAGLENTTRFTNYDYDSVIDKYFAQARFYDAVNGRMISIDPMYSDDNLYRYSLNNPINYVDPLGDVPAWAATLLKAYGVPLLQGFGEGVVEEVLNQMIVQHKSLTDLNWQKIMTSGVNQAIQKIGNESILKRIVGDSFILELLGNIAVGIAGNIAEQWLNGGEINWKVVLAQGIYDGITFYFFNNFFENQTYRYLKPYMEGIFRGVVRNLFNPIELGEYDWSFDRFNNPSGVGRDKGKDTGKTTGNRTPSKPKQQVVRRKKTTTTSDGQSKIRKLPKRTNGNPANILNRLTKGNRRSPLGNRTIQICYPKYKRKSTFTKGSRNWKDPRNNSKKKSKTKDQYVSSSGKKKGKKKGRYGYFVPGGTEAAIFIAEYDMGLRKTPRILQKVNM